MDDQNKNLLLATALSFLVILTWFILFPPEEPVPPVTNEAGEIVLADPATGTAAGDVALPSVPGATDTTPPAAEPAPEAARIDIRTPRLTGTISLGGGRIDDLSLATYRETLDPESDLVRLLSPVGTAQPYYAMHGWIPVEGPSVEQLPGPNTPWQVESGEALTPETPVVLRWDNGAGLIFRKTFAVDDAYMFTITQSIENTSDAALAIRPYGLVARHGVPDGRKFFILHEGVVRMSDGKLEEIDYDDMRDLAAEDGRIDVAENGWIGFTDKYWMTSLIPAPGTEFRSVARFGAGIYQTEIVLPPVAVAPGATVTVDSQLFAGAKEWEEIRAYQAAGIDRFIDSIDWGWFYFLTKPIFWLLHTLNGMVGNMGWSIILLTIVIKALVLPLAYKSYASMAKMKELQPEMEKLKERAGDDRQALQQGMMKLYKDNKVNPASGCLPILLQIPIFFSLYKVIFVTIELRQAPWIGWIRDLSAPDPSSILNLFGLLPWGTPDQGSLLFIFSLGVLPILLGISMWLQQKLNPAPTDPTQKMVFAWMPWIFMFMLGTFASGLVLYWIANNTITFTQQYLIMRGHGHKPDVFGNILSGLRRNRATESGAANSPKKPGDK